MMEAIQCVEKADEDYFDLAGLRKDFDLEGFELNGGSSSSRDGGG